MGATTLIDPSDETPVEQGHARPAEQAGDGADGERPRGGVATHDRRRHQEHDEADHVRPQHDRGRRLPARGHAAEEVADAVGDGGAEGEECGHGSGLSGAVRGGDDRLVHHTDRSEHSSSPVALLHHPVSYDAPHARCPTAVAAAVARNTRRLRTCRGWSLDQLASRSGVSKGMLVHLEGARTNPSLGTMCKIAETLGVSLAALVELHEAPVRAGGRAGGDRPAVDRAGGQLRLTCWWARTSGTTSSCGAGRWPPATGTPPRPTSTAPAR